MVIAVVQVKCIIIAWSRAFDHADEKNGRDLRSLWKKNWLNFVVDLNVVMVKGKFNLSKTNVAKQTRVSGMSKLVEGI